MRELEKMCLSVVSGLLLGAQGHSLLLLPATATGSWSSELDSLTMSTGPAKWTTCFSRVDCMFPGYPGGLLWCLEVFLRAMGLVRLVLAVRAAATAQHMLIAL
jgi:hypothetical protein